MHWIGPDFKKERAVDVAKPRDITDYSRVMGCEVADFTGDGWPDVIESGYPGGGPLYLYVNPHNELRRWPRYAVVDSVSEIYAVADMDKDGKPDYVYGGGGYAANYAKPDPADPTKPWIVHHIGEQANWGNHGLGVGDVNGDGFRETPSGQPWSMEVLTISDLTYSVAEGKLIVGWMNDVGSMTTMKTVSEKKAYDIWADQTFDMYIWGWGNEPDPDYTLSLFTKGQCLWWSDGCYYDPAYEEMYKQQHQATDLQQRIELVDKMQQYLYEQVPEIVLMYTKDLQAYRSDRFTGYQKQPSPVGSLFFAFGSEIWLGIRPVSEGQAAASSGSSIPVWVWIALVLVVVVLGGVFMVRRGKASADIE